MKKLLWLILLLFSYRAFSWTDVVFDLDEVLIYRMSPGNLAPMDVHFIESEGSTYWVGNGVPEMLEHLSRNPDIRISFFSSALDQRNIDVLKKIRLPSGQTAFDLSKIHNKEGTAPRIFSKSDTEVSEGLIKKDLRKVAPDIDLNRCILVDDQDGFALADQKRNLLWVPELTRSHTGLDTRMNVRDEILDGDPKEAKRSAKNFLIERNKSLRIVGLIEESMTRSKITGQSLVEELNKLQWEKPGLINRETLNTESPFFQQILKKTLLEFQAVNPDFKLIRLTSNPSACEALMRRVLAYSASP